MRIRRVAYAFLGLCAVAIGSTPALAYDWVISAKVTMIEVTYMPASIDFEVDHAGGS